MAQEKCVSPGVPEYNVLLLGESGAGKSTFINSFALYLQNKTWQDALDYPLEVALSTKFTEYDDNRKEIEVKEGDEDESECLKAGESGTMSCNSYLFNFDTYAIRLIDTPGMGSTVQENGTKTIDDDKISKAIDKKNVENILNFLSNFSQLHAIAVMVRVNENRFTTRFNYCLKNVMNNLHKSAIDNLVFVISFSHDRSFVIPKELKNKLKDIISSPDFKDDRFFMFDHKCFRYLLAKKNQADYKAGSLLSMISKDAWNNSRKSSKNFRKFVIREENSNWLKPHKVQETFSISDARKYVKYIQPTILKIRQIYENNQKLMKQKKEKFNLPEQINTYQKFIHHIQVIELNYPNIVCESKKCLAKMQLANPHSDVSQQICCKECQPSRINLKKQLFCPSFELFSGNCIECGCRSFEHHRRYYQIIDVIASAEETEQFAKDLKSTSDLQFSTMEIEIKRMDYEIITVETAIEKFKDFLKTNPIFSEDLENHHPQERVTPDEIYNIRDQLFQLDKFGPEIRKAYESAKKGVKKDCDIMRQKVNPEKVFTIVRRYKSNPNVSPNPKAQLVPK